MASDPILQRLFAPVVCVCKRSSVGCSASETYVSGESTVHTDRGMLLFAYCHCVRFTTKPTLWSSMPVHPGAPTAHNPSLQAELEVCDVPDRAGKAVRCKKWQNMTCQQGRPQTCAFLTSYFFCSCGTLCIKISRQASTSGSWNNADLLTHFGAVSFCLFCDNTLIGCEKSILTVGFLFQTIWVACEDHL